MDDVDRPETPPLFALGFENVKQHFEQDKLLIRKALDAFNAYSFAMKGMSVSGVVRTKLKPEEAFQLILEPVAHDGAPLAFNAHFGPLLIS